MNVPAHTANKKCVFRQKNRGTGHATEQKSEKNFFLEEKKQIAFVRAPKQPLPCGQRRPGRFGVAIGGMGPHVGLGVWDGGDALGRGQAASSSGKFMKICPCDTTVRLATRPHRAFARCCDKTNSFAA
jgi:hypothetical protein